MTKVGFLLALNNKLSGLPQDEIESRLSFYSEIIEDRMEEGLSEEEAVSAIGSVDEIAENIISETSFTKIAKEKITPKRRLKTWEIVLIVLGAPIWASLLVSLVSVLFSIYVSIWAAVISIWAVFIAVIACSFAGIICGAVYCFTSFKINGLALIGAGLVCSGLSVLLLSGCKGVTKAIFLLTKNIMMSLKKLFMKRSES